MPTPFIIIPACTLQQGMYAYHVAQMKYIDAVRGGAGGLPLILPAMGEALDLQALLGAVDGVLLTGSPSNVHPSRYGQEIHHSDLPLDPIRDETNFRLLSAVLQHGIPLLAICRGMQELNVALGGSLHQAVHELPGFRDHREKPDESLEIKYGPSHPAVVAADGLLARILGFEGEHTIQVNSLHGQAVDRLAAGLRVEALADDGLVEAASVKDAKGFALAVQWHPEWRFADDPASLRIFEAFGDACRSYRRARHQGRCADSCD